MKHILLSLIVVFLLFSPPLSQGVELIELSQLVPGSVYDYQRVSVLAWVRELKIMRGSTGSRHLRVVLGVKEFELKAFAFPVPILGDIFGYPVIIIGKYMPRGRFGGLLQHDFLILESITIDWEILKGEGKRAK